MLSNLLEEELLTFVINDNFSWKFLAFKLFLIQAFLSIKAVATPKQIRELMQVDGLTNDEVKSHLQVRTQKHKHSNLQFISLKA